MYCISLEALLKDGEHDKQKASALHSSIAQETIHIDGISIILRKEYRSNPQFKQQDPTAILLLKKIRIWWIPQILRYLVNSQDSQIFGEFTRFPGIWWNLMIHRYSVNSPDSQIFGEFTRFPDIWWIHKIPRYLVNSQNSQVFGEFSRFPKFLWEIKGG